MTKLSKLLDVIDRYPVNTILFSDDDLLSVLDVYRDILPSTRDVALAEALCRCWLYKDKLPSSISDVLNDIVPEAGGRFPQKPPEDFIETEEMPGISHGALKELKGKIQAIREADGVVPVVVSDSDVAIPLPFKLSRKNVNHDRISICDINGKPIDEWVEAAEKVGKDWVYEWRMDVCIDMNGGEGEERFLGGDSFVLPLLMAITFRIKGVGALFPKAMFTGSIVNGGVRPVDGGLKKVELAERLACDAFFIPEGSESRGSGCVYPVPVGSARASVGFIEDRLTCLGLYSISWRDAVRQMGKLKEELFSGNISIKDHALPKMELFESVFRENNRYLELIEALSLKAALLCHVGQAHDAFHLNEEVQLLAEKHKHIKASIELRIRQIVNFTDLGYFENAESVEAVLLKMITCSELDERDKNDLYMRFYGSYGQLFAYSALRTPGAKLKKKSLEYFKEALRCAEKHCDERECIHDLNYIHLWYALFDFGSSEEIEAFDRARAAAEKSDAALRNLGYLYRQKAFGAYRTLLETGECFAGRLVEPSESHAGGWTLAMTLKYKAALAAAEGDMDSAYRKFNRSMSLLADEDNTFLHFLGMTSAAQAWASLRNSEYDAFADECHGNGLSFFSNPQILEIYAFSAEWKSFLEGDGASGSELPQLKFSY